MPHREVKLNRLRVTAAFVILVVFSSGLVWWQATVASEARDAAAKAERLARENRRILRRQDEARVAAIRQRKAQILALCRGRNDDHARIVGFIVAGSDPRALRKIAYYREHPEEIPDPKVLRARAVKAFPQFDCVKLAREGPPPRKKG